MKTMLLALWFIWQAVTAPFYPNPATEVVKARTLLEARLRVGVKLKPDLIEGLRSAGFQVSQLEPHAEDEVRRERPWSALPQSRLYLCSKSVQARPAITVTDVIAMLAIGPEDQILHSAIRVNQTSL